MSPEPRLHLALRLRSTFLRFRSKINLSKSLQLFQAFFGHSFQKVFGVTSRFLWRTSEIFIKFSELLLKIFREVTSHSPKGLCALCSLSSNSIWRVSRDSLFIFRSCFQQFPATLRKHCGPSPCCVSTVCRHSLALFWALFSHFSRDLRALFGRSPSISELSWVIFRLLSVRSKKFFEAFDGSLWAI